MGLNRENSANDIPDVIILCGGRGSRLRPVLPDDPKSLAKIGEKPFLDILLESVFSQGFKKVILAVGHLKEKIVERYSGDPRIMFSAEESALGTGGAVMNALDLVGTENFIVMNGDAYCEVDTRSLYEEHVKRDAFASLALAMADDISDFGSVRIDERGKVLAFEEKIPEKRAGLINAGIYVFDKRIKNYVPKRNNFSIEHDLFPAIIKEFCYGYVILGGVLDIGTPERYDFAKKNLSKRTRK
jgi:NDP-sugar pyrophosphorylase family protein